MRKAWNIINPLKNENGMFLKFFMVISENLLSDFLQMLIIIHF